MKILKFSAEWCGPCKMLAQTMALENARKVDVEEIDIDKDPNKLVQRYGVRGVPTLIAVTEDGTAIDRVSGQMSVDAFNTWIGKIENV